MGKLLRLLVACLTFVVVSGAALGNPQELYYLQSSQSRAVPSVQAVVRIGISIANQGGHKRVGALRGVSNVCDKGSTA